MKKIVGATIGKCIHVMGLHKFLNIASTLGYDTHFAGQCLFINEVMKIYAEKKPEIIALSYRLTPESAEPLFEELKKKREAQRQISPQTIFVFGATPPVAEIAKNQVHLRRCFQVTSHSQILSHF